LTEYDLQDKINLNKLTSLYLQTKY